MLRHLKLKEETIDDKKLLEKYKAIWTTIVDFKNIRYYDDRYIKTKIRTFGDKVYTNFRGLNVPEYDIQCESFTDISIDSLLVYYKRYYLEAYLENCASKIVNKQMIHLILMKIFLKIRITNVVSQ